MRKVLIATHFKLAEGFKDTLSYFTNAEQIQVVNAFTEGVDYKKEIDQFFERNEGQEILAFSDIAYGSVNQHLTTYLGRKNYHLISGTNLPALLSILFLPDDEPLTDSMIEECIAESKDALVYMNHYQRSNDDEDE